eukprot:TRINITY_DN11080_c0_g1_i1.p1 TRINITY_DN11080_c0_g1~~TRINITY_DN11080_c0_g1_i1.p1  ORF type:complete len:432 (-),score=79.61 TRINITY_DN11080_c0_g1_i1:158-1453(-)
MISVEILFEQSLLITSIVFAIAAYAWYYYNHLVDKIQVEYEPTELNQFLYSYSKVLSEKYYPPFWMISSQLQGSLGLFLRTKIRIPYTSEVIRAPDGGELLLNWHHPPNVSKSAPIILILAGVTGGRDKPYITHMVKEAHDRGWRSVVLIFPGCLVDGDEPHPCKIPRFYAPHEVDDLKTVVDRINRRYPGAPIIGLGHSMGACMLVKYLSAVGDKTPMLGCLSLSNPFHWKKVLHNLENGSFLNRKVINPHFAYYWQDVYKRNLEVFKTVEHLDHDGILNHKSLSIATIDDLICRRLYGYQDLDLYHADISCHDDVSRVKIPLYVIHALDDPIVPKEAVPYEAIRKNPNCILAVTRTGGHTGWLQGSFPSGLSFADEMAIEWIEGMLVFHEQEREKFRIAPKSPLMSDVIPMQAKKGHRRQATSSGSETD